MQDIGDINATEGALGRRFARARLIGQLAEERARGIAEHVSTADVVRDMLSIVNAYGEEKLQYWGFSFVAYRSSTFFFQFTLSSCRYGTVLGAT